MRVDDSAEPTSQPCQSHRKPDNPVLAIPGSWVWSCLVATIYFKRKFAFWEIFPATQTRRSATTTLQGPGQTQLLPQCSVAGKRLRLSRKEFLPAPGSLLTLTSEVFPTEGDCSHETIQTGCTMSTRTALLVNSAQQCQRGLRRAETVVFNFLCLGDLERGEITRTTSGLKLMMVILSRPRGKPNVHFSSFFPKSAFRVPLEVRRVAGWLFFTDYPEANLEKKMYLAESMGS